MTPDRARLDGPWGSSQLAVTGFDHLPVLTMVLEGPDHVVGAANAAWRQYMSGRLDAIGLPYRESFGELLGQQVLERLDEVFRSGEAFRAHEWRVEIELDHELVVRYFDFTMAPWRHDDGVGGVLLFGADVTEAVLERQRLVEESEDLRAAYQEAQQLVTMLQDALLPSELPVLPRLQLAARYLGRRRTPPPEATGSTWLRGRTAGSRSWSVTWWATGWRRQRSWDSSGRCCWTGCPAVGPWWRR